MLLTVLLILSQDDCFNKSIHEIVSGGRGCEGVVFVLIRDIYTCIYPVEPPIKDAPNKGHLQIKDTIQSTKKSLSYSASTFLTSE